jgi:CheY-like chemotaxis protein
VLGNTELSLLKVGADSELRVNLEETLTAATRAKELVAQILSFSRKSEEKPSPISLLPILNEAFKMLRSTIPTTINIQTRIPRGSITVAASATQIHQVIMNLATNSYQALEDGRGTIAITVSEVVLDLKRAATLDVVAGEYVAIKISDTGSGIPEEVRLNIFEPFFTTKAEGKGTGLGLSVVHGIVRELMGAISVDSEVGKGTMFTVYLPMAHGEIRKQAPAKVEEEGPSLSGTRILFVDDEPALVRLGAKTLKFVGCEVASYTEPLKALAAFSADPEAFDVIITDQTMPGLTGVELVQKAKELRPDIGAIICTGNSAVIDEATIKGFGAFCLLRKPVPFKELAKAINDLREA